MPPACRFYIDNDLVQICKNLLTLNFNLCFIHSLTPPGMVLIESEFFITSHPGNPGLL